MGHRNQVGVDVIFGDCSVRSIDGTRVMVRANAPCRHFLQGSDSVSTQRFQLRYFPLRIAAGKRTPSSRVQVNQIAGERGKFRLLLSSHCIEVLQHADDRMVIF